LQLFKNSDFEKGAREQQKKRVFRIFSGLSILALFKSEKTPVFGLSGY